MAEDALMPLTEVVAPAPRPRHGTCDMVPDVDKPPCGKPLLWAMTKHGVWMPLDADPAPEKGGPGVSAGNVAIGDDNRVVIVSRAWLEANPGHALYTHHVVSCTAPKLWNQHGGRGEKKTTKGPRR